ncbi:hypothetical protein [Heliothis virescens ascovirus 3j]|uniref:Uncharacterized protein n=1 Tax=Heliothis virescens ascovirus 3j TaxID=1561067 RepID=A0A2Z5UZM0_9VIRU|nr:hypothetical protein [Heliothis virescens ascovirus 3j]
MCVSTGNKRDCSRTHAAMSPVSTHYLLIFLSKLRRKFRTNIKFTPILQIIQSSATSGYISDDEDLVDVTPLPETIEVDSDYEDKPQARQCAIECRVKVEPNTTDPTPPPPPPPATCSAPQRKKMTRRELWAMFDKLFSVTQMSGRGSASIVTTLPSGEATVTETWYFQEHIISNTVFRDRPEYATLDTVSLGNAMSLLSKRRNKFFGATIVVFEGDAVTVRQGCIEYINRQRRLLLTKKRHLTLYEVYSLSGTMFSKLFVRALKPVISMHINKSTFKLKNSDTLEMLRLFCEMHFDKKYAAVC